MLNKYELINGAVFAACLSVLIGWWALPLIPLFAFLWAWTGAGHGAFWRKILMPFIVCLVVFLFHNHWSKYWIWLSFPLSAIVLSLGYGIPSTQPPDPGSPLGRFWHKRVPEYSEFLTRATIWILLALSFIPAFF